MKTEYTHDKLQVAYGAIETVSAIPIALMNRVTERTTPTERDANAARLDACWNACLGIADPERAVPRLVALAKRIIADCPTICGANNREAMLTEWWEDRAREALALAEGRGGAS